MTEIGAWVRGAGVGIVAAAVALLFSLASGPGARVAAAEEAPAAGASAEDAPDGAAIWKKKCKNCHGDDGKATKVGEKKGSPEDLAKLVPDLTHEKIVASIVEGPEKMPSFKGKLTEAEIEAVARYTKEHIK